MSTPDGGRGWIRTIEAEKQQIYSLPPLATRELAHAINFSDAYEKAKNGAGGRTRTPDLLITNQLLYQLSYTSLFYLPVSSDVIYYIMSYRFCQYLFSCN